MLSAVEYIRMLAFNSHDMTIDTFVQQLVFAPALLRLSLHHIELEGLFTHCRPVDNAVSTSTILVS